MTDLARGHQNTHWISIYRVNTQLLEKIKAKDACNQKTHVAPFKRALRQNLDFFFFVVALKQLGKAPFTI